MNEVHFEEVEMLNTLFEQLDSEASFETLSEKWGQATLNC